MRPARRDAPAPARGVSLMARCDLLATIRPAPARGMSLMARPDLLPSRSVTWDLDPKVNCCGPHEMPRSERRLRWNRTQTACLNPASGSRTPCRLTFHQPGAPTLSGVRWSMGSWASARPRRRRRQGVPWSHGPAEETVNHQEVNLRLTVDGIRYARPRRGTRWPTRTSLSRRTGGRPPGVATARGSRR
jgi:hypothetical protein